MEGRALVTNIQRFSLHDGPGIRTTVFLKGCSLRCPWCSNPENINPYPEQYSKDGRKSAYGKYFSCDELYERVMRDRVFYDQLEKTPEIGEQRGGVTFSGGEPLLQFDAIEPLLMRLKSENVHICVESCLFVPPGALETAIKYVDVFYVDVKIIDKERCRETLGGDIGQYLDNMERLSHAEKPVIIRYPVIGGFTDDGQNVEGVIELLGKYKPAKVELLKEHNLGKGKYDSLGRSSLELNKVTDEEMECIKESVSQNVGIRAEICRI